MLFWFVPKVALYAFIFCCSMFWNFKSNFCCLAFCYFFRVLSLASAVVASLNECVYMWWWLTKTEIFCLFWFCLFNKESIGDVLMKLGVKIVKRFPFLFPWLLLLYYCRFRCCFCCITKLFFKENVEHYNYNLITLATKAKTWNEFHTKPYLDILTAFRLQRKRIKQKNLYFFFRSSHRNSSNRRYVIKSVFLIGATSTISGSIQL